MEVLFLNELILVMLECKFEATNTHEKQRQNQIEKKLLKQGVL